MKLTDKEARVIAAVELHAELPLREIQNRTGFRSHTIRHALGHLKQYEIIKRIVLINIRALGYSMHNFYFSVDSDCKAQRQALLNVLIREPQVLSIREIGTHFQYCVGICAQSIAEVGQVVKRMTEESKVCLTKKCVSTQFASSFLPRRYLNSRDLRDNGICLNCPEESHRVDELDKALLQAMSRCGDATHSALARELRIPATTVDARIKKLEQRKIIAGYLYKVASEKYHMQSYTLLVNARYITKQFLAKINHFSDQHPAIVQLNECFGSWDFELGLEVRLPHEVSEVIQDLNEVLRDAIHSVKVVSNYQEFKFTFFPVNYSKQKEVSTAVA